MWDLILFEITGRDAVLFSLKFQMIYHGKNFYEFPIHLTIYGLIFSEFFAIVRNLEQKDGLPGVSLQHEFTIKILLLK